MGIVQGYIGFTSVSLLYRLLAEDDNLASRWLLSADPAAIRQKMEALDEPESKAIVDSRFRAAREELDSAMKFDPHCDAYRFFSACLSLISGDLDVATVLLEAFLEQNPTHPNALRILAELYLTPPAIAPMTARSLSASGFAAPQGRKPRKRGAVPPHSLPAAVPSSRVEKEGTSGEVAHEAKLNAIEAYRRLLLVDGSHEEAFVKLCVAYKQRLISAAYMTEVVALRLDFFPEDSSLWNLLAHLVRAVLKQRTSCTPEEAEEIELRLSGWRKLVHWWKRNLLSVSALAAVLANDNITEANFELFLWRGVCCSVLLSRVAYLKTLALCRQVASRPHLDTAVRTAATQFDLHIWVYPQAPISGSRNTKD